MVKLGINNSDVKFNNRSYTLQLLFAYGLLSRTDIANHLHITTAAVTSIVNEFMEDGLLIQQDSTMEPNHKAGRRRAPLSINYDWKYILAIDIHSYYTNIAVTNLAGKIIIEESSLTPNDSDPRTYCSNIAKECIKMLWKHAIPTEKILGTGITIIGPVNQNEGIALHPFRLFDQAVPVKEFFEDEFPFPVAVESNVCAFLQSELLYNQEISDAQNILMLKWGPGVGSAMAIHGQVYKGYNYQSTEIGHNQIAEKGGKKCNCGRTGCLEPSISADAIIDFIQEHITSNPSGILAKTAKKTGAPTRKNLQLFLDIQCSELKVFLNNCAHALAAVTNNAIHILAPDKLILFGDIFESDSMVDLFIQQLYQLNPQLPENFCIKNHLHADKKYIGATAIAIFQLLL